MNKWIRERKQLSHCTAAYSKPVTSLASFPLLFLLSRSLYEERPAYAVKCATGAGGGGGGAENRIILTFQN